MTEFSKNELNTIYSALALQARKFKTVSEHDQSESVREKFKLRHSEILILADKILSLTKKQKEPEPPVSTLKLKKKPA